MRTRVQRSTLCSIFWNFISIYLVGAFHTKTNSKVHASYFVKITAQPVSFQLITFRVIYVRRIIHVFVLFCLFCFYVLVLLKTRCKPEVTWTKKISIYVRLNQKIIEDDHSKSLFKAYHAILSQFATIYYFNELNGNYETTDNKFHIISLTMALSFLKSIKFDVIHHLACEYNGQTLELW